MQIKNSFAQTMSVSLNLFLLFFSLSANTYSQCEKAFFYTTQKKLIPGGIGFNRNIKHRDLNRDGITDFVGHGAEINNLYIRKLYLVPGDATNGFGGMTEITLPHPFKYDGYHIVDFNLDGNYDFFFYFETSPKTMAIYLNDGLSNFTPLQSTVIHENEYSDNRYYSNMVDINGDNFADLLIGGRYRLANPDGTFIYPRNNYPGIVPKYPGDFNNDGKMDFLVLEYSSDINQSGIKILYNQGNGDFVHSDFIAFLNLTFISGVDDLNNDNKPEIIVSGINHFGVFMNLGDSFDLKNYEMEKGIFPSQNSYTPQIIDLNGDGFLDLITFEGLLDSNGTSDAVYKNDGTGNFVKRIYKNNRFDNYYYYKGIYIDDPNGDNKPDRLLQSSSIFNETVLYIQENICKKPGQTKAVNFLGSDYSQQALWNPNTGEWRYYVGYEDNVRIKFGTFGDIPVPGDYDGDGTTDIAVFRPSNGVWYLRNSSDESVSYIQFGLDSDKPVASDYDGDGKTDIAVFRPSDGNWYVLLSESQQVSITHFGSSGDKPMPEDYDGDNKTDLAVYRPSTGVWYVLKNSDNSFTATKWGIETDIPVPMDYDKDGKADLTVFRPSDGNWYVLRSFNNQSFIFPLGSEGDIPQPSSSVNEGGAIRIYRPSTNIWYSYSSSYGSQYGEPGEIPVSYILRND